MSCETDVNVFVVGRSADDVDIFSINMIDWAFAVGIKILNTEDKKFLLGSWKPSIISTDSALLYVIVSESASQVLAKRTMQQGYTIIEVSS